MYRSQMGGRDLPRTARPSVRLPLVCVGEEKAHTLQKEIAKDQTRYDKLNKKLSRQTFPTARAAEAQPDTQPIYVASLRVTGPTAAVVDAEIQRRATWILLTSRLTDLGCEDGPRGLPRSTAPRTGVSLDEIPHPSGRVLVGKAPTGAGLGAPCCCSLYNSPASCGRSSVRRFKVSPRWNCRIAASRGLRKLSS